MDKMNSVHYFPTYVQAEKIAGPVREDDPDWMYTVGKNSSGWYIRVYDNTGRFMGTL